MSMEESKDTLSTHENRGTHTDSLARELVDDIELGRLPAEALVLKTSRLARITGNEEIQDWLHFEMRGYNSDDSASLKYMGLTGRWVSQELKTGYWGPLAEQEATLEALCAEQKGIRVPDLSGQLMLLTTKEIIQRGATLSNQIARIGGIRSRVLGLLHDFVTGIYYESLFSGLSQTIFETYKAEVDLLLADHAGRVLEKLPAVYERLSAGDPEAVSQGLTTCRRLIHDFADAVLAPSDKTLELDGSTLKLGAQQHMNRINAFVSQRTQSKSRRKRLRQTLSNLHDRVSAGVHREVAPDEARALILGTYLILGEVILLPADEPGEITASSR